MYANIVLSGGGAKGAVLGGCLKAIEDKGIQPVGFGGTSAGSIVALLAAIGYSGRELEELLVKTPLSDFLDDEGRRLGELKIVANLLFERIKKRSWRTGAALASLAGFFSTSYGLYDGRRLREFLSTATERKLGKYKLAPNDLTFNDLEKLGCKPIRIVATELRRKRAEVFRAGEKTGTTPVIDAVLASASFPFVFRPVVLNSSIFTDGGLSSNLPSFLFEDDYRQSRTPTLAFDLVPPSRGNNIAEEHRDIAAFLRGLLGSALEASDVLLRESTPGVTYFPIQIPDGIDTLDFSLTASQREACFAKGYSEAAEKLERCEQIAMTRRFGEELQKRLIGQFGPPSLYEPVLRAVIQQLELASSGTLTGLRAHIMLLTGRPSEAAASTRIVTYSIGMD